MKLLLLVLLFTTQFLSAESSKNLKKNYFTTISPYYYSYELKHFRSFDGLSIAYKIFRVKNSKANIVISSGRTEGMLKYQEFIYDLNQAGYSVYILDHRGQGNSERLLKDTQIGHVYKFENYVKDLHQFVEEYVPQDKKRILIGHSMGGAIASLYAEKYQKDFDGLILSSPMHQPLLVGEKLNTFACELIEKRKRDIDRYVLGQGSYDDGLLPFEENLLTHSKLRYEIMKIAFDIEPETKVGSPSVRWVSEACRASNKSVENAKKIKIPLLLLQAKEDKIVSLQAQDKFCENLKNLCEKKEFESAYHELFVEKDEIRDLVLSEIFHFIDRI
jgi:lysophospholipase